MVEFSGRQAYSGLANVGSHEETLMRKLAAGLMALALALSSATVIACPGEKAKDGQAEMSTPAKPKS